VEQALGALGRVALLLDERLRVVRATATLDTMVCPHASTRILGRHVGELLGQDLFTADSSLMQALAEGRRQEGRRAFLQCGELGARLVSFSAAPLGEPARHSALGAEAHFVVIIRAVEDELDSLSGAMADLGIVTRAAAMIAVVKLIEQLHRSEATVLITGESGTGKEVIARAFHTRSPRRMGSFVAVNCGAFPAELLEAELFGHTRGAFTGAARDRAGRFDLARGGTLFLDEIGDMPLSLQVKLLRVLQERRYERLGESTSRQLDARIIAATNVDLDEAVESGAFRKDLYYRLRVVPVHLPPLRDRMEDIEPLARVLLRRIGERVGRALILSPEVLRRFGRYDWPGNVRELENALEYAVAICDGQTLRPDHLPEQFADPVGETPPRPAEGPAVGPGRGPTAAGAVAHHDVDGRRDSGGASAEANRIVSALERHHWHRGETAAALQMSRTTLWRRMKALGLT